MKQGRSFQTWEDENNCPVSKTRFREMILLKTATNSSNNGYFPLNVTWHTTWPVRSTNFTLNCSLCDCVLNLVPCHLYIYTFKNITNKLFLPVTVSDPGLNVVWYPKIWWFSWKIQFLENTRFKTLEHLSKTFWNDLAKFSSRWVWNLRKIHSGISIFTQQRPYQRLFTIRTLPKMWISFNLNETL